MKSRRLHLQYQWNCKYCQIFEVKKNGMMIWHTGRIQISTYACQLGKFQGKVDMWSHQPATQIACLSYICGPNVSGCESHQCWLRMFSLSGASCHIQKATLKLMACLSCLSSFCSLSNSDSSPRSSHTPHEIPWIRNGLVKRSHLAPKMWSHDQPMGELMSSEDGEINWWS